MDKEQAIHNFFSSFIKSYDENTVPDNAALPYLTYPISIGTIDEFVNIQPSLWFYGTSWADITQKAHDIMDGIDGKIIKYDNGAILLTSGTPKYQRMDSGEPDIRRMLLNINMDFLER